jgi:uncharacterized protein YqgV (UPF0045/DUF77 family)
MEIGVEMSLYPLADEYIPPIARFIERLNAHPDLKVVTNSMSTQVFGEYRRVFDTLALECRRVFEETGKAVFVMKILGPLSDPNA